MAEYLLINYFQIYGMMGEISAYLVVEFLHYHLITGVLNNIQFNGPSFAACRAITMIGIKKSEGYLT